MIGKLERDITQNPQNDWVIIFEETEDNVIPSLIKSINENSCGIAALELNPLRIVVKNLTPHDNIEGALKLRQVIMKKGIFINIVLTPLEQFKIDFSEVQQFDDDSLHLSRLHYTKEEALIKFATFFNDEDRDIAIEDQDIFESSILYVNDDDYMWETGESNEFLTWCIE